MTSAVLTPWDKQVVAEAVRAIRTDSSYAALMIEAARALEERKAKSKR